MGERERERESAREQHSPTLAVLIFPSAAVRGRVSRGEERARLRLVESSGDRVPLGRVIDVLAAREAERPLGRLHPKGPGGRRVEEEEEEKEEECRDPTSPPPPLPFKKSSEAAQPLTATR